MAYLFIFFLLIIFVHPFQPGSEWRKRTIYQLLTDRFSRSSNNYTKDGCSNLHDYCGGTFQGIIDHLDYITNLGMNAIWISPIVENTEGGYHGYWMKDLWKINPHFGAEEDLKNLIEECHKRDVFVMVDIVLNHVGNVDMDFGQIDPFNKSEDYHMKCQITDWNNQTQVEWCRLANLPDLAQEKDYVKDQLMKFMLKLRNEYNVDGFRLDTTPELFKWYLSYVEDQIHPMYITGEVFNNDVGYVSNYADILGSALSYPLYFTLKEVFAYGKSCFQIKDVLKSYEAKIKDPLVLAQFVDNHDNERFLHYQSSWNLYKNAITFILLNDEVSIIYYGTEQGFHGGNDPDCREYIGDDLNENSELYKFIQKTMKFKNQHVEDWVNKGEAQVERYVLDSAFAFSRGKMYVVVVNDNNVKYETTYHQYSENEKICDVLSGNCINISEGGKLNIDITDGLPRIYYPSSSSSTE